MESLKEKELEIHYERFNSKFKVFKSEDVKEAYRSFYKKLVLLNSENPCGLGVIDVWESFKEVYGDFEDDRQ